MGGRKKYAVMMMMVVVRRRERQGKRQIRSSRDQPHCTKSPSSSSAESRPQDGPCYASPEAHPLPCSPCFFQGNHTTHTASREPHDKVRSGARRRATRGERVVVEPRARPAGPNKLPLGLHSLKCYSASPSLGAITSSSGEAARLEIREQESTHPFRALESCLSEQTFGFSTAHDFIGSRNRPSA